MKKFIKYTLAVISAFSMGFAASAAGEGDSGIVLKKTLDKNTDGTYTITLDAFVTGSSVTTVTEQATPVDLVLVLDVSGSMDDNITTYTKGSTVTSYSSNTNMTYILVRADGTETYLKYRNGNNSNNRYWYTTDTPTSANGTRYTAQTGDVYYQTSTTTQSKMNALKDAVKAFVNTVAEKAVADNMDHQISIIKYADDTYYYGQTIGSNPGTTSTTGEAYIEEGNHRYTGSSQYNLTEVVKKFTAVNTQEGVNALNNAVTALNAGGATSADFGMIKAKYLLADLVANNPTRESNKVVVMFTDGEPNHSSDFSSTVANNAIAASNVLKTTYGAKVFAIGVFGTSSTNVDTYMNRLSSNYVGATSMTTGSEKSSSDATNYYQKSDGSNLTSIFTSIAHASASEGTSKKLTAEATTVIDKMSTNFNLPAGMTASQVNVKAMVVESYTEGTGYKWKSISGVDGYTTDNFNASNISVTVDESTGSVKVTGFDYTLADVTNESTGKITRYGNWVGPRKNANGTLIGYFGTKLVIDFVVELDPDYEGGYDVPSNDTASGIYLKNETTGQDELQEAFNVPTDDFPSICVIKEGLAPGESAVFDISAEDGTNYRIVLTQKAANGSNLPCYAVLKGIQGNTRWTVTETDWSWTYTTTPASRSITQNLVSLQTAGTTKAAIAAGSDIVSYEVTMGKYLDLTGTYAGNTYGIVYRQDKNGVIQTPDDATDGAVVAIYRFTNTKIATPTGLPARSEAYAHNKFKGGTATSGGTETGGNEEEDI